MVLGGRKRSRFWRRFMIPERLSAKLLNIISVGTLAITVAIMAFAPELQEFGRREMIKPDGSLPFEPLYRLDKSIEEQWNQFFRENQMTRRRRDSSPPPMDKPSAPVDKE